MRNIIGPSIGVVCLLVALAGCAGSGNPGGQSSAAPAASPSAQAVRVVALGDSDSTGSMTGQLLGTQWGVQCLPERWLAQVELREVIEQLASDMVSVAERVTGDLEARYPGW